MKVEFHNTPDFVIWIHEEKWFYQLKWFSGTWMSQRENINFDLKVKREFPPPQI